jgi:integrase
VRQRRVTSNGYEIARTDADARVQVEPLMHRTEAALVSFESCLVAQVDELPSAIDELGQATRISSERAEIISIYDFRHGRTTNLVSSTTNLAAVAYLVGHKHVSTTSKYVEAHKESAARMLREIDSAPA